MTHFETLPIWAAIPVALLVLFGAALTLIGALGLWRLPSFYDRLHAPTLGTSWGSAGIVLASILMFSVAGGRAVIHESAIAVFIMVTTPVTLMLLGRAALHRDRVEGNVPFQFTREDEIEAKAAQQLAQAEARANIIRAQEVSLAAELAGTEPVAEEPSKDGLPEDGPPKDGQAEDGQAEAQPLPNTVSPDPVPPVPELFPEPEIAPPAQAETEAKDAAGTETEGRATGEPQSKFVSVSAADENRVQDAKAGPATEVERDRESQASEPGKTVTPKPTDLPEY